MKKLFIILAIGTMGLTGCATNEDVQHIQSQINSINMQVETIQTIKYQANQAKDAAVNAESINKQLNEKVTEIGKTYKFN